MLPPPSTNWEVSVQARFYAFLLAGFFGFGLVSCSPDKSKPDDWVVHAPTLKSASNKGAAVDLHSGFTGEVSADSQFEFLSNQASALTTIAAHSSCTRAGEKSTLDRVFAKSSQIALASLLPDALIFSASNEKSICQFSFVLTNSAGSTRSFESRPITVGNFNSLENFPLEEKAYNTSRLAQIDLSDIRRSATRIGAETSVNALVCDTFQNSRVRQKDQTDQDILHALGEGEINLAAQPETLLSREQDPRLLSSIQTCRIVVVNQARDHAAEVITSSAFTLTFPASKPKVTFTKIENFAANTNLRGLALVTFEIQNFDPTPAAYRLSSTDLGFRADTMGMDSAIRDFIDFYTLYFTTAAPVDGQLEFASSSPSKVDGSSFVIQVPANGKSFVQLRIKTNFDCSNRRILNDIVIPFSGGGGGTTDPGECSDWLSCRVIASLNFHLRSKIAIDRLGDSSVDFTHPEINRDSAEILTPNFSFLVKSNAEAELQARHQRNVHGVPDVFTPLIADQVAKVQFCNQ